MNVTTAGDAIEIQPGSIVRRGIYQCLPTISKAQAVSEKCDWALRDRKDLAKVLAWMFHTARGFSVAVATREVRIA